MKRPVVGVIANTYRIENRFATQMTGERNLRAVAEVVDGIVLTGARANVHPTRSNTEPHERHEPYDSHRDDVALAVSEACVARGIPLFGICRGLQEMNVAFGGS